MSVSDSVNHDQNGKTMILTSPLAICHSSSLESSIDSLVACIGSATIRPVNWSLREAV